MLKPPILITGIPRSGTALLAGCIELCGASSGIERRGPLSRKNKYRNPQINDEVIIPYLSQLKVDPEGHYPLPSNTLPIPSNWETQIKQIMMREESNEKKHWYYKDAKLALLWKIWSNSFPDAKWIVIRRRSADIVTSCLKTGYMKAFDKPVMQRQVNATTEKEAWLWMVRQYESRFVDMIQAGLNVKVIYPERLFAGDFSQLKETIEWLGLKWNPEVYTFVDPKLWKGKK